MTLNASKQVRLSQVNSVSVSVKYVLLLAHQTGFVTHYKRNPNVYMFYYYLEWPQLWLQGVLALFYSNNNQSNFNIQEMYLVNYHRNIKFENKKYNYSTIQYQSKRKVKEKSLHVQEQSMSSQFILVQLSSGLLLKINL